MIKTVIIDDDSQIVNMLQGLLKENFQEIELCGHSDNVQDAVQLIKKQQADLVFLDIELTDGTGFQILQQLKPYKFKVIFITAFNDFALKAIKFSAIDYILKPVNHTEFLQGVEKAISEIENTQIEKQIQNFFDHYEKRTQSKKIVLRTADNLHFIDISEILYCKSDNSYTTFFMRDNEKIMVSKNLKEYETMLTDFGFFRPHHSFLVNLHHVKKLDKHDGGFLILSNNKEIAVSTRRKAKLMQILEKF